jgi:transposase
MITIGCDIGKRNFDVFLGGKHHRFENKKKGIERFIKECRKHEVSRIVLEPTGGYERNLLKELSFCKIPVSVVNPIYVRNFAKSKRDLAKTDKIDAKMLSEYGEKMDSKLYESKEAYRFDLGELTSRRDNLVCIQKEEKQRLEKEPSKIIAKSIEQHLKYLEKSIENIESEIKKMVEKNAKDIDEVLQSEKGIGVQTSSILIGSLPELGHLDNRQIAKLAGLAPMAHDSGSKSGKRSIRGGRERVRMALYMASISALRSNPKVKDFYKRLRAHGKLPKVAIVAVMRKLLVILNSKMRLFYEGKNYF